MNGVNATSPQRGLDEPIVIYQSATREGSTFALSTPSRRVLEQHFGAQLRVSPRVFIAHSTRDDYERLHGTIGKQIVLLLTGLSEDRLAEMGPLEFRDPVTEHCL